MPTRGGKRLFERLIFGVQVNEKEALPFRQTSPVQRVIGLLEILHFIHQWRAGQFAAQVVSPGMVGALNGGRELAALLVAQARAAVPADVEESVHPTTLFAHQNQALLTDLAHQAIAGMGDLIRPGAAHPALGENPLLLQSENLSRGIVFALVLRY